MSLKNKLILIFSGFLLVPVFGFYYAQGLTEKMLEIQQESVSITSRALSTALSDRPTIFTNNVVMPFSPDAGSHITIPELADQPKINGKIDDWDLLDIPASSIQYGLGTTLDRDFSARYRIGSFGKAIYIALEVEDQSEHKQFTDQVSDQPVDQVFMSMVDSDGQFRQIQIRPRNDGQLDAFVLNDSGALLRDENGNPIRAREIYGEVRVRSGGYDIEIRLFRSNIGPSLGLGVMNVTSVSGRPSVSIIRTSESLNDPAKLGSVFLPSPEIDVVIQQLSRSDARIWVVDTQGRIIAHPQNLRGIATKSVFDRADEGGFLSKIRPLFRSILNLWVDSTPSQFAEIPTGTWQLDYPEVTTALKGDPVVRQIRSEGEDKIEVIAAAHPVEIGNRVVGAVLVQETTNKARAIQYEAIEQFYIYIFVIFAVITITLVLAGDAFRRLADLVRQVEGAFDDNGKLARQVTPQTAVDEVGKLSRSLSNFSIRLRGYTQYLEHLSKRLSHELHTPIAVVRSSLDLLKKSTDESDRVVYLKRAEDGVDRLNNLVKRMSEAADLEASLINEEFERIDICALVNSCGEEYQSAYGAHSFNVVFAESPLFVKGSPEAIRQMLDKLIENAIEYAVPESSIDIGLSLTGNKILLQVTNLGPLIPVDKQSQIFDSMISEHPTGHQSSSRTHLGLGLHIVRLVAQYHGGEASVRNRSDKQGVTFEVSIPNEPENE